MEHQGNDHGKHGKDQRQLEVNIYLIVSSSRVSRVIEADLCICNTLS